MNNAAMKTIVAWQTRNAKRHQKAVTWCKDYGLTPLVSSMFIGDLYSREERMLKAKLKREFSKKTDTVFLIKLCQTCYATAGIDPAKKEMLDAKPDFELVQITGNGVPKYKNPKKSNK